MILWAKGMSIKVRLLGSQQSACAWEEVENYHLLSTYHESDIVLGALLTLVDLISTTIL